MRAGTGPGRELWPHQQARGDGGTVSCESARVSSRPRLLKGPTAPSPATLEAHPYQAWGPERGQAAGQAQFCCPLAPLRPCTGFTSESCRRVHLTSEPPHGEPTRLQEGRPVPSFSRHRDSHKSTDQAGLGGGGLVGNKQVLSSLCLTPFLPQVAGPGAESGPRLPVVLELEVGSGLVRLPRGGHAHPTAHCAGGQRLSPSPQLVQRVQTLSQLLLSLQVRGLPGGATLPFSFPCLRSGSGEGQASS